MLAFLAVVSDVTLSFYGMWCIFVIIRRRMMNMERCKNKGFSVYLGNLYLASSSCCCWCEPEARKTRQKHVQNEVSCQLYNSCSFLKSENTLGNQKIKNDRKNRLVPSLPNQHAPAMRVIFCPLTWLKAYNEPANIDSKFSKIT